MLDCLTAVISSSETKGLGVTLEVRSSSPPLSGASTFRSIVLRRPPGWLDEPGAIEMLRAIDTGLSVLKVDLQAELGKPPLHVARDCLTLTASARTQGNAAD